MSAEEYCVQRTVLKKCNCCNEKIDLRERYKREKNLIPNNRSRHDYCQKCQNKAPL